MTVSPDVSTSVSPSRDECRLRCEDLSQPLVLIHPCWGIARHLGHRETATGIQHAICVGCLAAHLVAAGVGMDLPVVETDRHGGAFDQRVGLAVDRHTVGDEVSTVKSKVTLAHLISSGGVVVRVSRTAADHQASQRGDHEKLLGGVHPAWTTWGV